MRFQYGKHFGRFGWKVNPIGAQVTWTVRGRTYLADVVGLERNEQRGCWILKTRHFNGEAAPDVAATFVTVLERE